MKETKPNSPSTVPADRIFQQTLSPHSLPHTRFPWQLRATVSPLAWGRSCGERSSPLKSSSLFLDETFSSWSFYVPGTVWGPLQVTEKNRPCPVPWWFGWEDGLRGVHRTVSGSQGGLTFSGLNSPTLWCRSAGATARGCCSNALRTTWPAPFGTGTRKSHTSPRSSPTRESRSSFSAPPVTPALSLCPRCLTSDSPLTLGLSAH